MQSQGQQLKSLLTTILNHSELRNHMSYHRTADLTLEPKEKGGEVTFISNGDPCLVLKCEEDGPLVINNIKMLYRG
jgi:hypothetical protein